MISPFFLKGDQAGEHILKLDTELKRALEQKQHMLLNIKDLDFDYDMGKISKEDHERLCEIYKAKSIVILKNIDRLEQKSSTNSA